MPGEKNGNARLTDAEVEAIRKDFSVGDISQTKLASRFGISPAQIHNIVTLKQRLPKDLISEWEPPRDSPRIRGNATLLPVYRNGELVAWVTVDHEVGDWAKQHRWRLSPKGYVIRSNGRRDRSLHREIMGLEVADRLHVDHKNRNKLDCRRQNLRVGTQAQNNQNVPSLGGTSKYRGVSLTRSGKWRAVVKLNGKQHYLGTYVDEKKAARVASEFRAKHMPFAIEPDWTE